MKHEQVVPDYWMFIQTSGTYLFLAFCGLLLIRYFQFETKSINLKISISRLIQAVFWLPRYLERNQEKFEEMAQKHNIDIDDLPRVEEISEPDSEEIKKDK